MKKSRPGSLLTVLSPQDRADRLEALIFAETTTFGIRRSGARRSKLSRDHRTVQTPWGPVRVKVGRRAGQTVTAAPEYDDCRRVARDNRVPLRQVMQAALRAWNDARP
jgi:uncharacterized protein (DUF111 family)